MLTAERLRSLLDYDPATGLFTHKVRRSGVRFGSVAGSLSTIGYIYIAVDGKKECAHRLAFLHMTGSFPDEDVDHINGNRSDNRFCNLRSVSRRVNNQNRFSAQSNNSLGLAGVSRRNGRYIARIKFEEKQRHIGRFDTAEEAAAAYLSAKRIHHEGCTV